MHFVYLRPGLCLQLPPHAPSRPRCRTMLAYDPGRTPGVTPTSSAVAVRLGVPVIKVSRGLSPPSHFPFGFRLPVLTPTSASASCPAHSGSPASSPAGPPQIRPCRLPAAGSSESRFAKCRTGGRCAVVGAETAPGSAASSTTLDVSESDARAPSARSVRPHGGPWQARGSSP